MRHKRANNTANNTANDTANDTRATLAAKAKKPSTLRVGGDTGAATQPGTGRRIVRLDPPAFLWRGFHHRWGYNHRINRIGSYVRHVDRGASATVTEGRVGHPAASGSGPDTATADDLFSEIDAPRVWFQPGVQKIRLESKEGNPQRLNVNLEVDLDPGLKVRDNYTVVINGFDLMAERDADKLSTFSLSITEPKPSADGARLRFDISAMLNVDCDTLECDIGVGRTHVPATAATAAGAAVAVTFPQLAWLPLGEAVLGKLNLSTDYTLKVHYLIIAGDAADLNLVDADLARVAYGWDDKNELRRSRGETVVKITADDAWHDDDVTNTFAFRHLQIAVEPTGKRGAIRNGAMHLLEWSMAIEEIHTARTEVSAQLVLFYKNWAEGMRTKTLQSVTAHRDSGTADLQAGLQLLQFKGPVHYEERQEHRRLQWKVRNKQTEPKARNEAVIIAGR